MSSLLSMSPVGFTPAARWRLFALAGVAMLVAAFLGAEGLGAHALWLDEAYTVHDSARSVADILTMTGDRGASVHPPLPYLLMRPFVSQCGTSEACLRAPSVFFFAATGFCLVVMSGRLFGWGAAWFTTLLWPSLPYAIKYAQQARAYTLLAFLSAASLLLAIRALRLDEGPSPRSHVFVALGATLGLVASTHLLGTVWIASLIAWGLLWRRTQAEPRSFGRQQTLILVAAFVATAALGAAGLLGALDSSPKHLGSEWGAAKHYWRLAFGLVTLGSYERVVPVLVVVGVFFGAVTRRFTAASLLALAVAPLLLFALRRPTHFITLRHIMPSVVVIVLLAACGFASLLALPNHVLAALRRHASARVGIVLGVFVAALPCVPLFADAAQSRAKRATGHAYEPWDQAAAWVNARAEDGAVAVVVPTSIVRYPLEFYPVAPRMLNDNADALAALIADGGPPQVFVVWSHIDRSARERKLNAIFGLLRRAGYQARDHEALGNRTIIVKVFARPADGGSR